MKSFFTLIFVSLWAVCSVQAETANTIFHDTFAHGTVGDNLDASVPDTAGTSWTVRYNDTHSNMVLVRAGNDVTRFGSATIAVNDAIVIRALPSPTTNDIDVTITFKAISTDIDDGVHIYYRDANDGGSNTFHLSVTGHATTKNKLYKVVSGSRTQIGSTSTSALANGDVVKISVRGNDHTVYVNDVSVITATDSALAANRGVVLAFGDAITGWDVSDANEIDEFKVDEITASAPASFIGQIY